MFMLLLANDSQRMFSRPVGYKRDTLERDLSFRRPSCDCLACYDSGVMTNGDGLVNGLLPDYDRNRDGRLIAGQDLPVPRRLSTQRPWLSRCRWTCISGPHRRAEPRAGGQNSQPAAGVLAGDRAADA